MEQNISSSRVSIVYTGVTRTSAVTLFPEHLSHLSSFFDFSLFLRGIIVACPELNYACVVRADFFRIAVYIKRVLECFRTCYVLHTDSVRINYLLKCTSICN